MNEIEVKLNTLLSDDALFHLLKLILELGRMKRTHIDYNQSELIRPLHASESESDQYNKLKSIAFRFNGLCELISNSVIADNLMGSPDHGIKCHLATFKKELLAVKPIGDQVIQLIYNVLLNNASNPYKDNISLMHLDTFSNTHILDVSSYSQQMFSYFLGVYPYDLFSFGDEIQVGKTVNQAALKRKLDALEEGSYIKFMTFKKGWLRFHGHSMVIKKTGDKFSFFDPNHGEAFGLEFPRLCDRINEAMKGFPAHQPTHMSFIDGDKFIHYMSGLNQQSAVAEDDGKLGIIVKDNKQESLASFILTELDKITKLGQYDDEDLVNAMDGLRTNVEIYMRNTGLSTIATEKEVIQLSDSQHYTRNIRNGKFQQLNKIQFELRDVFWCDLVKSLWVSGHHHTPKDADLFFDFDDLEFKLSLQLCKSVYDFGALLRRLNVNSCQKLCDMQHVELSNAIKTTRTLHVLFSYLKQNDPLGYELKCAMVYNIIESKLHDMVQSANDVNVVASILSVEQRTAFFNEAMLDRLSNMITSAGDVGDIFKYLSQEQASSQFDKIKHKMADIIHNSDNSAYAFQLALGVLNTEQRTVFFDSMREKIPCLHLESYSVYQRLMDYLSQEQADFFTKSLPENEVLDAKINDIQHSIDLCILLKNASEAARIRIFDATKNKIFGWIRTNYNYNNGGLAGVLQYLPPAQYELYASDPDVQQFLAKDFTSKNIPATIAEPLSAALLSQDDDRIQTEIDCIIERNSQSNWDLFGLFSTNKTIPSWIKVVSDFNPYWLKKINKSLKLNLNDEQLFTSDFSKHLCEYCNTRVKNKENNVDNASYMPHPKSLIEIQEKDMTVDNTARADRINSQNKLKESIENLKQEPQSKRPKREF